MKTEGLSQTPCFYSIEKFPQFNSLISNWCVVREEYLQLSDHVMDIDRAGGNHKDIVDRVSHYISNGNSYGWVQGWGRSGANAEWIQYGILAYGEPIPFLNGHMKKTLEFLAEIPGIKIAALSTLMPGASLPCHRHPEISDENLLQLHLPLKTAEKNNFNYINVAGEFRQHICGVPIIFDGSNDHFVLNESKENRTILYLEFENYDVKRA